MQNNNIKYNLELKPTPRGFHFWYSFNKHKIPVYFMFLSFLFFTAFLDFNMVGTPFLVISHINTINRISSLSAFFLFLMYLVSIIQLFNVMGYSKKLNPFGAITFTILTVLQVFAVGMFTYFVFFTRAGSIKLEPYMIFSVVINIVGLIFMVITNVFVWLYVDWNYVKVIDE